MVTINPKPAIYTQTLDRKLHKCMTKGIYQTTREETKRRIKEERTAKASGNKEKNVGSNTRNSNYSIKLLKKIFFSKMQ